MGSEISGLCGPVPQGQLCDPHDRGQAVLQGWTHWLSSSASGVELCQGHFATLRVSNPVVVEDWQAPRRAVTAASCGRLFENLQGACPERSSEHIIVGPGGNVFF